MSIEASYKPQINPITQKAPIEEAEHFLSNYRGSLQIWGAVQSEKQTSCHCWGWPRLIQIFADHVRAEVG